MQFNNVAVLGAGKLGTEIAFHTAIFGHDVRLFDISEPALRRAEGRFGAIAGEYRATADLDDGRADTASTNVMVTNDLEAALDGVDLVIEAIPEVLDLKRHLLEDVHELAPPLAVVATNTSQFLVSELVDASGRPDRFLALHYMGDIWASRVVEIVGSPAVNDETRERLVSFARETALSPVVLQKEYRGYIVNALLIPFLTAAAKLWVNDVADAETVDATWVASSGAATGPFHMFDAIGLETVYNITSISDDTDVRRFGAVLKERYLDAGRTGALSAAGFYTYGNA